jgi:hypothetical protein
MILLGLIFNGTWACTGPPELKTNHYGNFRVKTPAVFMVHQDANILPVNCFLSGQEK